MEHHKLCRCRAQTHGHFIVELLYTRLLAYPQAVGGLGVGEICGRCPSLNSSLTGGGGMCV